MNLEFLQDRSSLREISLTNILPRKELIIVLQYGGEESKYAKEFENFMPKEFFDWIVLYENNNGKLKKLYEYECA